ncbi:MAG: ABC transporter ATP-binding protein [Anaerolineae bacterium]|jgi:ABC-type Fe3+/spermidine/putrescine transport system ATPase subunit
MGPKDLDQPRLVDLALHNLCKRFGTLEVLKDLTLEVYKGELCCLLGPSGCGKTTTLKIVAGFLAPDGGKVHLTGEEITHKPPQRRGVGMVFQNYALFPHMNVYDNVAYGLRRHKWPKAEIGPKVREVLRLVQLEGYEVRRIHELSGGQQQRIALARSLVIEPKLLLLDEPLSNLDARLRADMRDEIRRIQRKLEITTVYVTHDQEEAMSLADRIVVMNEGAIEQIGPAREIYEQPATAFVADFIGRVNLLPGRIEGSEVVMLGQRYPVDRAWTEGEAVVCAVRPERVRVRASIRAIPAVIKEAIYVGATVHYRATVAGKEGQQTLAMEIPSPEATYRPGEEVEVDIQPEDIQVFAA